MSKQFELVPLHLSEANTFVTKHHRHHKPVPGAKFAIGVATRDEQLVGVAIVGRPVARHLDDGLTLEVNRTCTDGTKNANSFLYGAAWRAVQALGYTRLITYTRSDEAGCSLLAANWKLIGTRPARSWRLSSVARPRQDASEPHERLIWEHQ